jgi:hypothetical protein
MDRVHRHGGGRAHIAAREIFMHHAPVGARQLPSGAPLPSPSVRATFPNRAWPSVRRGRSRQRRSSAIGRSGGTRRLISWACERSLILDRLVTALLLKPIPVAFVLPGSWVSAPFRKACNLPIHRFTINPPHGGDRIDKRFASCGSARCLTSASAKRLSLHCRDGGCVSGIIFIYNPRTLTRQEDSR